MRQILFYLLFIFYIAQAVENKEKHNDIPTRFNQQDLGTVLSLGKIFTQSTMPGLSLIEPLIKTLQPHKSVLLILVFAWLPPMRGIIASLIRNYAKVAGNEDVEKWHEKSRTRIKKISEKIDNANKNVLAVQEEVTATLDHSKATSDSINLARQSIGKFSHRLEEVDKNISQTDINIQKIGGSIENLQNQINKTEQNINQVIATQEEEKGLLIKIGNIGSLNDKLENVGKLYEKLPNLSLKVNEYKETAKQTLENTQSILDELNFVKQQYQHVQQEYNTVMQQLTNLVQQIHTVNQRLNVLNPDQGAPQIEE